MMGGSNNLGLPRKLEGTQMSDLKSELNKQGSSSNETKNNHLKDGNFIPLSGLNSEIKMQGQT